jgi:hypothetical protein
MSFAAEFDAAFEKSVGFVKSVRNAAVLQVGNKIIDDTPVDTGALKGSWKASLGVPSSDGSEILDGSGQIPKAALKAAVEAWPEEGSLFQTNFQDYSEGVEFDGYSVKQPAGMVRRNIAIFSFASLKTGTGRTE